MSLLFPFLRPMLATLADEPFTRRGWSHELKWDGIRALAYLAGDDLALYSRNGHLITDAYPDLADLRGLRRGHDSLLVLDGEIVTLDARGVPDFQRLQSRFGLKGHARIQAAAQRAPATFVAFDLLVLEGRLLVDRPLGERREHLRASILEQGPLVLSRDFGPDGYQLFEQARRLGFEGVVAKRLDSRYRPGRRSLDWLKVKVRRRQDCAILGWTEGNRAEGFGALLLGVSEGDRWRYAGKVGSGFDGATIRRLMPVLRRLETPTTFLSGVPQAQEVRHWLRPALVGEVEFSEWTLDGVMRAPVFVGLRPDKDPEDCPLEAPIPRPQEA